MSDDLQYGINEACIYFYSRYEDRRQLVDDLAARNDGIKLNVRNMNVLLMMGVGYLIAKGRLTYRGDQHYGIMMDGFEYYKSLIKNGDIVP